MPVSDETPSATGAEQHYRALERLYASAPVNAKFASSLHIPGEGRSRLTFTITPDDYHAAGAAHGTIYFKMLDDAAFYAANSLVTDRFLLTTSFNLHFTKPVRAGYIRRVGSGIYAYLPLLWRVLRKVSAIVRDHTRLDGASVAQYALADVTDHVAMHTAFASVAPFDGVVNATGVVAFGNVADLDDATLARLFAVNAIAPIVMLRESAAHIADGGFFVNLSGVVATQPVAGMAAYSASKAAAWAAMGAAARELRRRRVDVIQNSQDKH